MLEWLAALRDPETAAIWSVAAAVVGRCAWAFLKAFREGREAAPAANATAMRAIGAGVSGSLDGAKLNETLERIAASVGSIAISAATLAKLEEQGTAEAIEEQGKKLDAQGKKLDEMVAAMRRRER